MGLCYECGFNLMELEEAAKRKEEEANRQKELERRQEAAKKYAETAKQRERERWMHAHPDANGCYYEYRTVRIRDNDDGCADVYQIQHTLNDWGYKGWRLVTVGKVSSSSGYAGISRGTNATIEEVILVFERVARI